jgi:hypothetical protein
MWIEQGRRKVETMAMAMAMAKKSKNKEAAI